MLNSNLMLKLWDRAPQRTPLEIRSEVIKLFWERSPCSNSVGVLKYEIVSNIRGYKTSKVWECAQIWACAQTFLRLVETLLKPVFKRCQCPFVVGKTFAKLIEGIYECWGPICTPRGTWMYLHWQVVSASPLGFSKRGRRWHLHI